MKQKTKARQILRWHSFITSGLALIYLIMIIAGGCQLFFSDWQHKTKVAGAMISAVVRVPGPPKLPIVATSSNCSILRVPYVSLSWPMDEDATTFDIYRNGAELMLGLTENNYMDNSVVGEANYTYVVVANGSLGTATSKTTSITVQECPAIANPRVELNTFSGKTIKNAQSVLATTKRRPNFYGTTNIPNANINLQINSRQTIYATTSANETGFWQWTSPVDLSIGKHSLLFTAIDPINSNVTVNNSFRFEIKEESDTDDEQEKKKAITNAPINAGSSEPSLSTAAPMIEIENSLEIPDQPEKPIDFVVTLEEESFVKGVNIKEEAYRGKALEVKISFTQSVENKEPVKLSYVIFSPDKTILAEYSDTVFPQKNEIVTKKIPLSSTLALGKYKIQVNATVGDTTVSHESYFLLKDQPVMNIGQSVVTYAGIINSLSWWISGCLVVLVIIGFIVGWEHHLHKQAMSHVTEKILKKGGFIN